MGVAPPCYQQQYYNIRGRFANRQSLAWDPRDPNQGFGHGVSVSEMGCRRSGSGQPAPVALLIGFAEEPRKITADLIQAVAAEWITPLRQAA